ncbi:hypothetical protein LTS17_010588 [Exophiala oligosperma]
MSVIRRPPNPGDTLPGPAPPDARSVLKRLKSHSEGLMNPDESEIHFPRPLPTFKAGKHLCLELLSGMDLVTSRNCYSRPSLFDRTASKMFDNYDKDINLKRKDIRRALETCETAIRNDDDGRMSEGVYKQLIELQQWALSLALRSEAIYTALARAKDRKLERDLREQALTDAKIENVKVILEAISSFVPDLHAM